MRLALGHGVRLGFSGVFRSRQPSSLAVASITAALGATLALGCEESNRCWNEGSCNAVEGDAAPAPTAEADAGASTDVLSETSEATGSESAAETTGPGSDTASSASSAPVTTEALTSSDTTAEPTSDPTTTSDDTSTEQVCGGDDECGGLICVGGTCQVCDPIDHRGCADSPNGNRCRQADEGNSCVVCLPGDAVPQTEETCGINQRGTPSLECVNGLWQTTACDDPDVCEDGAQQVGETPCGPNESGRYLTACAEGQWVDDTSSCIDDDQCVNGTRRTSDSECGFSGYLEQQCVNGAWLTQSNRCLECLRTYRVPDSHFEEMLSRNNITADPVDPDSVKYMFSLDLSFGSIQDITGIQCFSSLNDLMLGKNQVSDLTPLASLTELRNLNLAYNDLFYSSLEPLGNLTQLTFLSLEATAVTSLEGLQPLTALQELRVPYNHIEDVTPLLPLTSLQNLSIYGNGYGYCESDAYATLKTRIPADFLFSDCP